MCTCISQQICTYWLQLLETLGMELFVAEMLFVSYLCFCFLFVLLFFVCLNTLMVDLEAQEVTGKEGQERDNKVLVGGARV